MSQKEIKFRVPSKASQGAQAMVSHGYLLVKLAKAGYFKHNCCFSLYFLFHLVTVGQPWEFWGSGSRDPFSVGVRGNIYVVCSHFWAQLGDFQFHQTGYKGAGPMGRSEYERILQLPAREVVDQGGETGVKGTKPDTGPWQWMVYCKQIWFVLMSS